MKIVILDAQTVTKGDVDLNVFDKYGELAIYPLSSPDEIVERTTDADIIICNKSRLGKYELAGAKNLKFITLFATGYNNIDVDYCRERGIVVANAGSYSTDAVAQHTFALILEHFSRVGDYSRFVNEGGWLESPSFYPFVFPADELAEKTLGIFGLGSIGQAVADIALAFKMNVIACTRTPKNYHGIREVDFDTLLCESDVISLHCPLTPETRGKFNAEAFAKCRDGAYLVNCSRGPVVVERDLLEAVRSGKLSGAGVDVIEREPMTRDCILRGEPNITVTPHVAWGPLTTRRRLINIVCENIESFLAGAPKNKVN